MSKNLISFAAPRRTDGWRVEPLSQLDPKTLSEWAELEKRALEPNPFLSPDFVIPAAKHLTPHINPQVLLIRESRGSTQRLSGIGVFVQNKWSRRLPAPHLAAYATPHDTFMSGLLIEEERAQACIEKFFEFVSQLPNIHGIDFEQRCRSSAQGKLLPRASEIILDLLRARFPEKLADGCADRVAEETLPEFGNRSRAFLRIQEGCDLRCSYCVIPSVRGDSVSVEPAVIERGFRALLATGYKEVVLTGVNTGDYGKDLDRAMGLAHPEDG